MPDWSEIRDQLVVAGVSVPGNAIPQSVTGGDISAAWRLATVDGDVFIKTGPLSAAAMFSAEQEGLSEIAASKTVRVPMVVAQGRTVANVFLALEWLDLAPPDVVAERQLGENLARMHQVVRGEFGWHRDNTIGLTPQCNQRSENWIEFFRQHRLGFQLQLAAQNGFTGELQEKGRRLLKRLPIFFNVASPDASLLHGDLWGGNWASNAGSPVLFDPAVYYGDRETDIALTRLFGGFGAAFYDAYETCLPPREGHGDRLLIYQLYHVLNHLNLFGSAYLGRATGLLDELL